MGGKGLRSKEALLLLYEQLLSTLDRCNQERSVLAWMREAWMPGSCRSLFRLTSLVYSILLVLALVATRNSFPELVSASIMITLTILNLALSGWESQRRSVEIFRRAENMTSLVKGALDSPDWLPAHFPHSLTPDSASLVLQLTMRDGLTVNLPWALLVTGDTILLRPGQCAPARCQLLMGELVLDRGQVCPEPQDAGSQARQFVLQQTPFLEQLELVLERANQKPLSVLVKQRHFLISSMLEYITTPVVLATVLAWNCVRHMYSWSWLPDIPMSQLFLTEPVTAVVPLLPLLFPIWWVLVNTAALANVLTILSQGRRLSGDPFDDTVEPQDMEHGGPVPLNLTLKTFWSCFFGKGEHLCRSENILHGLGSVTSFCCTDKKGILSWPNTSPEKMFFFKKQVIRSQTTGDESQEQQNTCYSLTPEILTISQDPHKPYQVQFDDPSWKQHLPSMKPLGLSVLLNTCNSETEEQYSDFYQFLRSEVAKSKNRDNVQEVLPDIPSRGCLCQLSKKIGLRTQKASEYDLVHQIQSFKALTSRDPFSNRNSQMAGQKFPPPHQISVLTRRAMDQSISLHSQGTADLVLDMCVDAWTGHDLTTLKPAEKKKCLEFYQRATLTSYCTTFAYKPLSTFTNENFERNPIEIPLQNSTVGKTYDLDSISVGSFDEKKLHQDDASDTLTTLHSQSFLGMMQMQYQAMVDMVQFIDLLEKACIRFVHFSKENELRSKVFSEKMGLESGWNCHISLHSQSDVETATDLIYGEKNTLKKKFVDNTKSFSVPNKLNQEWRSQDILAWGNSCRPLLKSHDEDSLSSDVGSISSFLEYNNRAQLPAGIEKIRPHLDTMDNVPLLVSLFTDCTPDTTNEMLKILQENGEVVVTIGSSANYHNMRIFLTADASISLEPLYPQVCQKIPVMASPGSGMGPTELARHLVSLPVSVSIKREDDVSVYRAIIRSRRHVLAIRHGLQLWTSCCMFLSSLVMTSLLLSLPSPLTPPQMLIITSFYIPLLSTASFFSAYDSNISNISTGKNKRILFNKSSLWLSIWCYGSRFLIAFLAVSLSHFLSILELSSKCKTRQEDTSCYQTVQDELCFITDTNMTFLVIYLVCTSFSFVSRTDHIWQYKLKRSWHICLVSGVIILLQSLYFFFSFLGVEILKSVPIWSWIILGACVPIQFFVNELVKRHEIKVNVRFQKRARLDFNTKLGINSPF